MSRPEAIRILLSDRLRTNRAMCGRYRDRKSVDQMRGLAKRAATVSNAPPNLDVRPTTQQFVMRGEPDDSELTRMPCDLMPSIGPESADTVEVTPVSIGEETA